MSRSDAPALYIAVAPPILALWLPYTIFVGVLANALHQALNPSVRVAHHEAGLASPIMGPGKQVGVALEPLRELPDDVGWA